MVDQVKFPKGSEWRQWDLHIHSPASFEWKGQKFSGDPLAPVNYTLVDEMIQALNDAEPAVFALMDYWTFDGWFALKARLECPDAPKLNKTVFPGIELRVSGTKGRLNAHAIFSDKIADQDLKDFQHDLELCISHAKLSDHALIDYARNFLDRDQLASFNCEEIKSNSDYALLVGKSKAQITTDSYIKAIGKIPKNKGFGFLALDTYGGLTKVCDQFEDYNYAKSLFNCALVFETRTKQLIDALNGIENEDNKKFYNNFRDVLNDSSRLAISGSDAHKFRGAAHDNNNRGYGDFPSGKITWIKADPTFLGLLQAIQEPAKRCFIGKKPPKLEFCEDNKPYFIDRLVVNKVAESPIQLNWLHGCDIQLNQDLVVIIGNKGSGKSALADILGLLGDTKQYDHFSFLTKKRFLGKKGEPAKNFEATLTWCDGTIKKVNLATPVDQNGVERVQYIPHGYFEDLCNEHQFGNDGITKFEAELRKVVFNHVPDQEKLGTNNFESLRAIKENQIEAKIDSNREKLKAINKKIVRCELDLQPENRQKIEKLIEFKNQQIESHQTIKPLVVEMPSDVDDPELVRVRGEVNIVSDAIKQYKLELIEKETLAKSLAIKIQRIHVLINKAKDFERSYMTFRDSILDDVSFFGFSDPEKFISFSLNENVLKTKNDEIHEEQNKTQVEIAKIKQDLMTQNAMLNQLKSHLDRPDVEYQNFLTEQAAWNFKQDQLVGSPDDPESLKGLQQALQNLSNLPKQLNQLRKERGQIVMSIFYGLQDLRKFREELYKPVQEAIKSKTLINESYRLQFQAKLTCVVSDFSSQLFEKVLQNTGDFRGEKESLELIENLANDCDFDSVGSVMVFLEKIHKKLQNVDKSTESITKALRARVEPHEVYDWLFGLSFIRPKYSLAFQGAEIEQLSPGQRGALLLIFYLLVDKNKHPIVLDQPEENLDNETVVSLLVPVLTQVEL